MFSDLSVGSRPYVGLTLNKSRHLKFHYFRHIIGRPKKGGGYIDDKNKNNDDNKKWMFFFRRLIP